MKKKSYIIVGLGYGDEGKGLVTDYLCRSTDKPVVIRYNGGHQAGHTVVLENGHRHTFSCFGAGTLRCVPTFWSKYCTFSPAYLLHEFSDLLVTPELYVDMHCPVTTHYDVLFNRAKEATLGDKRLGSCGVGFGATIDRHYGDNIPLYFMDLLDPYTLKRKLEQVHNYYKHKVNSETSFGFEQFAHPNEDASFFQDVCQIRDVIQKRIIIPAVESDIFSSKKWNTYVFEGAQGVLLDQTFGAKPFITKSNTTCQNALDIIYRNFEDEDISSEIFYVSRGYFTRHGFGPFKEIDTQFYLTGIESESNIYNEHQGTFRYGFLDLNLLQYSISCDNQFSKRLPKHLIFTCLDHLPNEIVRFYKNHVIEEVHYSRFPALLSQSFEKVLYSFHPTSEKLFY